MKALHGCISSWHGRDSTEKERKKRSSPPLKNKLRSRPRPVIRIRAGSKLIPNKSGTLGVGVITTPWIDPKSVWTDLQDP
eukprot:scaffold1136_cov260-Pinguiococcus_pyrenoidosus.AAC.12